MAKIIIEKEKLENILTERIFRMRDYELEVETCVEFILKDLEPYRIKEKCEVM